MPRSIIASMPPASSAQLQAHDRPPQMGNRFHQGHCAHVAVALIPALRRWPRDQTIQAVGVIPVDADRDTLLGTIGRRILTGLDDRHATPAARRRHRILALLQEDPTRL